MVLYEKMLGMKKANYRFFNISDKKLIWKELKKIIIEEAEEYEKVIEDRQILSLVREIYTSSEKVSPEVMRGVWIRTNKQSSKLWKKLRTNLYAKKSVDKDFVTINDVINSSEVREAVTALRKYGIYKLETSISQNNIRLIQKRLDDQYVTPSDCNQQMMVDKKQMVKELYQQTNENYIRWHFDSKIFNEIDEIRDVCNMDLIQKIAEEYLGAPPFQFNDNAWISKGLKKVNKREISGAAQYYHYDYDSFNFLKVLIYL